MIKMNQLPKLNIIISGYPISFHFIFPDFFLCNENSFERETLNSDMYMVIKCIFHIIIEKHELIYLTIVYFIGRWDKNNAGKTINFPIFTVVKRTFFDFLLFLVIDWKLIGSFFWGFYSISLFKTSGLLWRFLNIDWILLFCVILLETWSWISGFVGRFL